MMTAMNKPPEPHSDSEDSDSPPPPPSTSHTTALPSKSKSFTYQPNIKSKLLSLKNKNLMRSSSLRKSFSTPNISPSYPITITPPVIENPSPPPPDFNLLITPNKNISPCHSQLSSPPCFHNSPLLDDTNFSNSSNDSPIHNIWQSNKLHPPTPPPIKTNDIPLTSVSTIFDQPESPVKTYSSCRFPPE